MASGKDIIGFGNKRTPPAEDAILKLLEKKDESVEDTKDLWNQLKEGPFKSMRNDKGLIKLLREKHITRMWEIAACRYSEIAHLMAPNDKDLKALHAKTVKAPNDKAAQDSYAAAVGADADPIVDAMLPQAGKPPVKFIVKRGEIKRGWGSFSFPWAPNSKGFPFKDSFEMMWQIISNGDKPNKYRVHFGGIVGENSNEHRIDIGGDILLSVERNPDPLPLPHAMKSPDRVSGAPKSCVVAFTFGVAQANRSLPKNDQIKVYIRFAGPNVLVGKAFTANWKPANESENLWGDLVLVKDENN